MEKTSCWIEEELESCGRCKSWEEHEGHSEDEEDEREVQAKRDESGKERAAEKQLRCPQHHLQCLTCSVSLLQQPIRRGLGHRALTGLRPLPSLLLLGPEILEEAEGVLWGCVQRTLRRGHHPPPPLQALLSEETTTAPATAKWGGGSAGNRKRCSEQVTNPHIQTRGGGGIRRGGSTVMAAQTLGDTDVCDTRHTNTNQTSLFYKLLQPPGLSICLRTTGTWSLDWFWFQGFSMR